MKLFLVVVFLLIATCLGQLRFDIDDIDTTKIVEIVDNAIGRLSKYRKHPRYTDFNSFKDLFKKYYEEGSDEDDKRFENYVKNLAKIDELNLKSDGAEFGVTSLSDLSEEEFKSILTLNLPPADVDADVKKRGVQAYPFLTQPTKVTTSTVSVTTKDFCAEGRCGPIKNQGSCGSCWAHATVSAVEAVVALKEGKAAQEYAQQQLIDCSTASSGCNGGYVSFDYIQVNGIKPASAYLPTSNKTGTQGTCLGADSPAVKLSGWAQLTTSNENEIANTLAANTPFAVSVDADAWQNYKGGVMTASTCAFDGYNHLVLLVGFDKTQGFWKVQNSWGPYWGDKGFIYLKFNENTCGIKGDATGGSPITMPIYTPTTPTTPPATPPPAIPPPATPPPPTPPPPTPLPTPPPPSTSTCTTVGTKQPCVKPPSYMGTFSSNCYPFLKASNGDSTNYCFIQGSTTTVYQCSCTTNAIEATSTQYNPESSESTSISAAGYLGIGIAIGAVASVLVVIIVYLIKIRPSTTYA